MRLRYVMTELGAGLRRNVTMTVAVIVTVWISLVLFGTGLLLRSEVNLLSEYWNDKIVVQVYMCNGQADEGKCSQAITGDQRDRVKEALTSNANVSGIEHESRQQAFENYRKQIDDAAAPTLTPEQMQESFKAKLSNPTKGEAVKSAVEGLDGVDVVESSQEIIDKLLRALGGLQWIAVGLAGGLLVAGILQIGNTIRLTVFSRRREIGIMRLVGASSFYIQLPYILESVVAALAGAALACGTLAFTPLLVGRLGDQIRAFPWIGWSETLAAMPILVVLGIVLAVVASMITLRRHLRV